MRIAIFADNFLPQVNGVVTATLNLAKGMANKGHEVLIIAPKYSEKCTFSYKNIEIFRQASMPAFFYPDLKLAPTFNPIFFNYLRKKKIDVIHFVTPLFLGMQAIISANLLKKPLIGTFHTFFADDQYLKHAKLNYSFMQSLGWSYSNMFYNKCNLVTSPSFFTKRELSKNGCKVPIKVISNGINPDIFDDKGLKRIKAKYGKNSKLILFVGRLAYEKNLEYLLECFSLVLRKFSNVKLLIIGSGPQEELIKKKSRDLLLDDNVFFLGSIKYEILISYGYFQACDLFVTASKTENQPMTILEAQQNGLVCVGLKEKGVPDLIKNNVNGFLLKDGDKKGFANAIINLLTNEKLYESMKDATLKHVKKHHINGIVDEWEKTYLSVINSYKK
ncbi:MAG: glycosyltransferase [Candidatus Woesearchaeota archaeon]